MHDRDLYARILGILPPWTVGEVELDDAQQEVSVYLVIDRSVQLECPACQKVAPRYDFRTRRWRHLDTCQYRTILLAEVPRVRCPKHGIHQIRVHWAEPGSRFTALFECLAIDWLREASLSAVARRLKVSWDQVDGIISRAIRRGLKRRRKEPLRAIGVDETSFQKGHQYVTVVSDIDRRRVICVEDDRDTASLNRFYETLSAKEKKRIEVVAMDMHLAYMDSTRRHIPDADKKIAFDKFHVVRHLGKAVDEVRRAEHRELLAEGDRTLTGTKYFWLRNPANFTRQAWTRFEALRKHSLKVGRAWALKEAAMNLWHYVHRGVAEREWRKFIRWALRSRLDPMIRAAWTIEAHLTGIVNAVILKTTNSFAESANSIVQSIKSKARGFRNRERFRNAIYFHLGGLDLYPSTAFAHTKS